MLELSLTMLFSMAIVIPTGVYLYHIAAGKHTFVDPVFDRFDSFIYRIGGVHPQKGMNWKQYTRHCWDQRRHDPAGLYLLRIQSIRS